MAKENPTRNKKKSKKNTRYNADNEIIIGVTTKPKEVKKKVRVEKKSTRTATSSKKSNHKSKSVSNKDSNSKRNEKQVSHKAFSKKIEQTKEQKIKRKNRKRFVFSFLALLVAMIGGTIYFLTTPMFNITDIKVYGNQKNTEDTYISLSKIELGTTNIFNITSNRIRSNIKENAYVEDVTMKRKLPNTIELYITERKVDYQVAYGGSYLYFNKQGYLLEINEEKADVLLLKGLSLTEKNISVGSRVEPEDLKKLSFVLELTNYFEYHSIESKIASIDVTDSNHYSVCLEEGKILYLGNGSNLNERLSLLKAILEAEASKKGEIFMDGNLIEDKVFFREEIKQ